MTHFAEKIRPRIVFNLTIHREHFYGVDLINLTFHFDINIFAEKLPVVFSLSWLFFHSARCFITINQFDSSKLLQFDWLKIFELDCLSKTISYV
jgi:hypothetical protein